MTKQFWAAADGSVINFTPSGSGWRKVSPQEAKKLQVAHAVERLREILQPGSVVYTVLMHRAPNGLSRRIKLIAPVLKDGKPYAVNISRYVARATGYRLNDSEDSLVMGGSGMDMGFQAVYQLGRALWPHGTPEPHGTRNGDGDGGYALAHQWL